MYGLWAEEINFDGQLFHADLVNQSHANRAGFQKIYAIDGLPLRFEEDLVKASQISDVPHTWRVKECQLKSEVTEEILSKGKVVLKRDMQELGAHVMTYVGELNQNQSYEFLAAGAIRNKLTRDYQNNHYPVLSRAIVAPDYRGKGLGSLIVEHRLKAILNRYFGTMPKAIHFGTESKKILHAIKKFEQEEGLKFVYIGDERYTATDGMHTVSDFLCFIPWFKTALMDACECLETYSSSPLIVKDFQKQLESFMQDGLDQVSGAQLEALYKTVVNSLQSQAKNQNAANKSVDLIEEVFVVKKTIGACDPQP
jgi:GNAT superfamily N-acetyltransferase